MLVLTIAFFFIAMLYATVGFGGGTSYIGMLALISLPFEVIPKISLFCNVLVVSGGCWHYYKNGLMKKSLILPFVISSVPMAFMGGYFPLTEKNFYLILTISLLLCGLRILFIKDRQQDEIKEPGYVVSFITGGLLGLLSGMVGIGGGIFLSPLLINLGWARSKNAAAIASVFILVNSFSGLVGQFAKSSSLPDPMTYVPLFIAVIVGGQIGSRIGTHGKISYALVQKGTGLLTLFISIRLLFKVLS
jgi:uncharacterized membrane protein YfcA